jgi:hypothetical protein
MFWNKKKETPKINEKLISGIGLEVAMYSAWTGMNGHGSLIFDIEATDHLIKAILKRENLPVEDRTVFMIRMFAISCNMDQAIEIMKKTGFNHQVPAFCESVGIPYPGEASYP